MKHLGDITKISGYSAPIVDCIIGGSPCQDLSVAGKRAGLEGERSGLFMEQIRIVKEMRKQDERMGRTDVNIRPRYMVWENVPGAFSSNKGEDFRVVLEEIAKVKDQNASIPLPDKGKWTTAGCIVGDGWSIAWRVLDAQFWGVPQRRRRIALVADFGGQSASEILFVRQSMSGYLDESQPKRKDSTTDATGGIGVDVFNTALTGDKVNSLVASGNNSTGYSPKVMTPIAPTCVTGDCLGFDGYNGELTGDKQSTLGVNCGMSTGRNGVLCYDIGDVRTSEAVVYAVDQDGINSTLVAKGQSAVAYSFDPSASRDVGALFIEECGKTLTNGTCPGHHDGVVIKNKTRYIVRRLTPLECERLQGYPDGWTDIGEYIDSNGKKRQTSDAARYKALGNSIALPPWKWVLKRICACYERDATMASLFDGIGGFPYLWEQLNGKGSCLWASEIEEFPMAVTKVRIGE